MKKHLKVILASTAVTSAVWALALAIILRAPWRGPQPNGDYFTYVTVPSHTEAPSALVVEKFSEPWSGSHTEILRSDIPAGEQRHYAFRIVQSSALPAPKP